MDGFEFFKTESEAAQRRAFDQAVEVRAREIAGDVALPRVGGDGTIFAVEQFPTNATAYSTMHYPAPAEFPTVIMGAFHADIPEVRKQLEAELEAVCFRVERTEADTRRFHDATPDVHIFAPDRETAEAFKDACPDSGVVSRAMGFASPQMLNENGQASPTVVTRSYPAGYDDGPAQQRLLVPYLVHNITADTGLHMMYCKRHSTPDQYAYMAPGNSGGEARTLDGRYAGVVVRAGYNDRKHFAVVQPLHNQMVLV